MPENPKKWGAAPGGWRRRRVGAAPQWRMVCSIGDQGSAEAEGWFGMVWSVWPPDTLSYIQLRCQVGYIF